MDYGIIFIIILILIIVGTIIALIYVNRNNTLNILASLPTYRILHLKSNSYLSLKNVNFIHSPAAEPNGIPVTNIPNLVPFWQVYASAGFDNTSAMGLWKFETPDGTPIKNGTTTVKVINSVYNLESPNNQGFLFVNVPGPGVPPFFGPNHIDLGNDSNFTLTTIDTNTFTLRYPGRNNAAVVINPTNNLLGFNNTAGALPDVFKLQLV